jgi:hypothetical protein
LAWQGLEYRILVALISFFVTLIVLISHWLQLISTNNEDDENNDSSDDETEQQTKINFFDKFINKFKENLRKVLIILLFMNNLN